MTESQGREAIPQIAAILKKIDICQFATRSANGQLHARPMSNNSEVEFDGDSWFFAPSDGRLVAELRRDPSAVTAYRAGEGYTFVSVSGRAAIETDPELKKKYWLDELKQWFPNGPEDANVSLIRLEAEHAEWWGEQGDGSADLREIAARA
jgi:general stress protein 26